MSNLHTHTHTHIYIYTYIKVKVKWSRYRPGVAQRVGRGIALLFRDRGSRRGWVVSSMPRPTLPPGKTRCPFYRRLGGPQGWSGRAKNLVATGILSRTVQPVVSRYTDWATRPPIYIYNSLFIYVYIYIWTNNYTNQQTNQLMATNQLTTSSSSIRKQLNIKQFTSTD